MATTASAARNHFAPRSNRPSPPRATKVVRLQRPGACLSPFTAYAPSLLSSLLVFRRSAGLREQSARPGLNEKNQRDENENLCQHGSGVGLQQLVQNPHRHAANERAPEISDAAKN